MNVPVADFVKIIRLLVSLICMVSGGSALARSSATLREINGALDKLEDESRVP